MADRYTPIIDISDSTNLTVTAPITLTDDDIGIDYTVLDDDFVPYTGATANVDLGARTLAAGVTTLTSVTNPQLTIDNDAGETCTIGLNADGLVEIKALNNRLDLMSATGQQLRLSAPDSFVVILSDTVNKTHLMFDSDNSGDIGLPSSNRPGNIYASFDIKAAGDLYAGTSVKVGDTTITDGTITDAGQIAIAAPSLLVDSTLVLAGGSITDASGAITFGDETLTTTGLVTAGVFNTTSSEGNTATLASIGVIDADPSTSFKGLLEVTSDDTHKLPTGAPEAIAVQAHFDAASAYDSNFHAGYFGMVYVSGETANTIKTYSGLYGELNSTITAGDGSGDPTIFGLNFKALQNESWTRGAAVGRSVLSIGAIKTVSAWSISGKEISGDTRAFLYGYQNDVTLSGSYDSTTAGNAYGEKIEITDDSSAVGAGATVNSYGLHIKVPTTGNKAPGTFNSYAAVMGDGTNQTVIADDGTQSFAGTARFFLPQVDDDAMDATNGTEGEVVFNLDDNIAYVCTTTGTPATWTALHA